MSGFEIFQLRKQLRNAIRDLGFESPTPIQERSFSTVLSGKGNFTKTDAKVGFLENLKTDENKKKVTIVHE